MITFNNIEKIEKALTAVNWQRLDNKTTDQFPNGDPMTIQRNRLPVAIVAAAGVLGLSAQFAAAAQLEEVLITAQKRAQTLQDVPVAVSAYSGDFMDSANIMDLRGLVDFTPGFSGRTEDSFTDALAMRGIVTNDYGIGGDPSVAVFTDGVWAGRNGGVQVALYDVERAEVVKGPQGTLFGRNAIAGAVSIITNKPIEEFEASLDVTLAEYNHIQTTGTVNQPLTDKLYFRGSLYYMEDDGYLENIQGGDDLGFHEATSTRLALRYAGDTVDAIVSFSYEDRNQDPSVYWDPDAGLPHDKVDSDLGDQGFDTSEIYALTANIDIELGNGYSLTSTTGYKSYDFDYLEDYDASSALVNNYRQKNEVEYFSQEFRINSPTDQDVVWFAGTSVYQETVDGFFEAIYNEDDLCRAIGITDADDFDGPVAGCDDLNFEAYWEEDIDPADILSYKAEQSFVDVENSGWAIYGDLTWSVTDRLDLTAGARYTYDEKQMESSVLDSGGALYNNFNYEFFTDGTVKNKDDWSAFTPRLALNYELSEEVSLYTSASKGYKSGGFATFGFDLKGQDINDDGSAPDGTQPKSFDSEEVLSFEAGAKARLFDQSMQLNASVFHYTYEDLQLVYFEAGSSQVANVGEAEGQGVEADMRYLPSENWDIYLSAAYLDTEITKADDIEALGACGACAGNKLPFAPELSGSAIVTYKHPVANGEAFFTTEYIYQDEMFGGPDNIKGVAVDSWSEVNFRLGYDSANDWTISLWVENALDEEYFERGWENADTDNQYGYGLTNTVVWPSKPRTVGMSFGMKFN